MISEVTLTDQNGNIVRVLKIHSADSITVRVEKWEDARLGHMFIGAVLTATRVRNNEDLVPDLLIASQHRTFLIPLSWDRDAVQIRPWLRTQTIAATERLEKLGGLLVDAWPEIQNDQDHPKRKGCRS